MAVSDCRAITAYLGTDDSSVTSGAEMREAGIDMMCESITIHTLNPITEAVKSTLRVKNPLFGKSRSKKMEPF